MGVMVGKVGGRVLVLCDHELEIRSSLSCEEVSQIPRICVGDYCSASSIT